MPAKYTALRRHDKADNQARKTASDRPQRPYTQFPFYAHPLGYWSKQVNKHIKHFGR